MKLWTNYMTKQFFKINLTGSVTVCGGKQPRRYREAQSAQREEIIDWILKSSEL